MSERARVAAVVALMCATALAGVVIATVVLSKAAIDVQRERLREVVLSRALIIESVAAYDMEQQSRLSSDGSVPTRAFEATLAQIRAAHGQFPGFGATGEFTMAHREGNQIIFVLSRRHDDLDTPAPVPLSSQIAEPMRRALAGQSGTMIGLDYRGTEVLAAYEPISSHSLGLVAKIDLAEVRAPFVRAGALAIALVLPLIIVGTVLILRIANPMVTNLQQHTAQLLAEVESREAAELRIERLNSALLAIRNVNQLIVREQDPQRLADQACGLLTATQECDRAWLAIGERHAPPTIRAAAGSDGPLQTRRSGAGNDDWPSCLLGLLSSGDRYDIRTPGRECPDCPEVCAATEQSVVVTLVHGDTFFGLLGLVFPEDAIIDDRLLSLLVEVADDLALALRGIAADQQRVEAESALRRSEQWYRLAQELSGLGAWEWNIETDTIHWSDNIIALWGYSRDEFTGSFEQVAQRVHPDDIAAWQESIRACVEDGAEHRLEFRLVMPDGCVRWVEAFGNCSAEADGTGQRMMGLVADVTERKRAEARLKQSEELLAATGEMARVGGWEVDLATETVRWTETTKKIHEVPDDYVPTIDEALSFFPEAAEELTTALDLARTEGAPYDLEIPFVTATGRRLWTRTIGRAEFADGECTRLFGTFQDITDRKTALDAAEANARFLDSIIEHSPFAMWISSREGLVQRTNRSLCSTLNVADEAIVGKYNVLEDTNLEFHGVMPLVRSVFDDLEPARFIIPWRAGDAGDVDFSQGRDLHIDVSMFPILDGEGTLQNVVCQWVDITELKRAEGELRNLSDSLELRVRERTTELETANRQLEEFAYSVSHDLRAPLRAINGFADIIANRHRDDLNEEGCRYFDNILTASQRMGRLIDDLLRYARLGRQGVALRPVALDRVVGDVLETLAETVQTTGATVSAEGLGVQVWADTTLLEQVVLNLVGNALKYCQPNVPPVVAITQEEHEGHVVVHVADNGIGIEPRFHEKIFAVFQRLHSHEEYAGTGIGLAVAAKATTLMTGRIWVDSEKGKGSTFHVALKAAGDHRRKEDQ